jgi:ribosomal protein L10
MASSVLGEKVAKQLESIPLSNDTVSRRISDMVSNVKEQLIEKVKASKYYSIQLDESTDVSNIAYLLTLIDLKMKSQ